MKAISLNYKLWLYRLLVADAIAIISAEAAGQPLTKPILVPRKCDFLSPLKPKLVLKKRNSRGKEKFWIKRKSPGPKGLLMSYRFFLLKPSAVGEKTCDEFVGFFEAKKGRYHNKPLIQPVTQEEIVWFLIHLVGFM